MMMCTVRIPDYYRNEIVKRMYFWESVLHDRRADKDSYPHNCTDSPLSNLNSILFLKVTAVLLDFN